MPRKKCIYCLAVDDSETDWSGEHHFAAQLGCPNRDQFYREVCPGCNNTTSKLETVFKEDTPEGYLSAMYKLGRGDGYRSTGKRMKVTVNAEGIQISSEHLFRVDTISRKLKLDPQTTFTVKDRRITIFKKLSESKLKHKLRFLSADTYEVVSLHKIGDNPFHANAGSSIKASNNIVLSPGTYGPVTFTFSYLMDRTIKRLIAKMGFNYFAKCALPAYDTIIFDNELNALRKFVLLPDEEYDQEIGIERTLVPSVRQEQITFNGATIKAGEPFHLFRVSKQSRYIDGCRGLKPGYYQTIICEINLFSLNTYEVNLGFDPFSTVNFGTFGTCHIFDIANKKWIRVKRNGYPDPPDDFKLIR